MRQHNYFGIVLSIAIFLITSCEKEEKVPDYVGTWATLGSYTEGNVSLEMKDVMTLTTSSFTEVLQIKMPGTNKWIDFMGLKGSLTVTGNLMNIVVSEIGMTSMDMITGMPTGVIVYYSNGQAEFDQLISEMGMAASMSSEFNISGDALTLMIDGNGDGDTNDEGETTVYSRQ